MAMRAKGINFQVETSPSTFEQILNITEFTLSGTTWDQEATTNHDTTTPVKTFQTTLRSDGDLTLVMLVINGDSVQEYLQDLSETGAANNFRITYPNNTQGSFDFSGYVLSFQPDNAVNGLYKYHCKIGINGTIGDDAAKILTMLVTDGHAGAYVTADSMTLAATFDELVTVTGTPRVPITLTSGTVYATYTSGSGTNVLNFSKTFGGGDSATATNVHVTSPMDLNGGTVKDVSGQAVTLTFTPPTTSAFHVN